jgi:hypothetical protein
VFLELDQILLQQDKQELPSLLFTQAGLLHLCKSLVLPLVNQPQLLPKLPTLMVITPPSQ